MNISVTNKQIRIFEELPLFLNARREMRQKGCKHFKTHRNQNGTVSLLGYRHKDDIAASDTFSLKANGERLAMHTYQVGGAPKSLFKKFFIKTFNSTGKELSEKKVERTYIPNSKGKYTVAKSAIKTVFKKDSPFNGQIIKVEEDEIKKISKHKFPNGISKASTRIKGPHNYWINKVTDSIKKTYIQIAHAPGRPHYEEKLESGEIVKW